MATKEQEQISAPESVLDEQPATHHQRQPSSSRLSSKGGVIAALAAVLVIGALGGFLAGIQVGKTPNVVADDQGGFGGQMQQGGPGGMMRRMGAFGTVTAVSDGSVTIEDQMQGGTTSYTITSSTTVTDNGLSASVSDIEVGDTVMIRTDSSSSTTAVSIQLNPSMQGPNGANQSQSDSST